MDKFTILYTLERAEAVTISIYDVKGTEVSRFKGRSVHESGGYQLEVEAGAFPQGVYIVRLATPLRILSQQIVKR